MLPLNDDRFKSNAKVSNMTFEITNIHMSDKEKGQLLITSATRSDLATVQFILSQENISVEHKITALSAVLKHTFNEEIAQVLSESIRSNPSTNRLKM